MNYITLISGWLSQRSALIIPWSPFHNSEISTILFIYSAGDCSKKKFRHCGEITVPGIAVLLEYHTLSCVILFPGYCPTTQFNAHHHQTFYSNLCCLCSEPNPLGIVLRLVVGSDSREVCHTCVMSLHDGESGEHRQRDACSKSTCKRLQSDDLDTCAFHTSWLPPTQLCLLIQIKSTLFEEPISNTSHIWCMLKGSWDTCLRVTIHF